MCPIYGLPWPQGTDTSYLKTSTKVFLNLLFKHCFNFLSLFPPFRDVQSFQVFLFLAVVWHSACGSSVLLVFEQSSHLLLLLWVLGLVPECTTYQRMSGCAGDTSAAFGSLGTRCACRIEEVKQWSWLVTARQATLLRCCSRNSRK